MRSDKSDGKLSARRGITYDWVNNDQVVVFTVNDFSKGALNRWINTNSRIMRNWPRNRDYYALIHVPQPFPSFRLFLEKRASEIYGSFSRLQGREALLMPTSQLLPSIRLTLDQLSRHEPGVQRQIFSDYDMAMNWLREGIVRHGVASRGRALIVDDSAGEIRQYTSALDQAGYAVYHVDSISQADAFLDSRPVDLLLIDIEMRSAYGVDFLRRRKPDLDGSNAVVIGMYTHRRYQAAAEQTGVPVCLQKPVDPTTLLTVIQELAGPYTDTGALQA